MDWCKLAELLAEWRWSIENKQDKVSEVDLAMAIDDLIEAKIRELTNDSQDD